MNLFNRFKKVQAITGNNEMLELDSSLKNEIDYFDLIDWKTNDQICEMMSKVLQNLCLLQLTQVETSININNKIYLAQFEANFNRLIIKLTNPENKDEIIVFLGIEYYPEEEYGQESAINDYSQVLNPNSQFQVSIEFVVILLELINKDISKRIPERIEVATVVEENVESSFKRPRGRGSRKPRSTTKPVEIYQEDLNLPRKVPIKIITDEEMGIPAVIQGESSFQRVIRITEARKAWRNQHEQ